MSRRDVRRPRARRNSCGAAATHAQSLAALLEWLLPGDGIFAQLKFHGNTSWSPRGLIWLALGWAWSESRNLTDAFVESRDQCRQLFGVAPVETYQGLMLALVRWTGAFLDVLWPLLHQRMEDIGGKFWRVGGWVPIAFDGSRSSAPRTVGNEAAFCAANYGRGKTARYRKKQTKGQRRRKNEKNPPAPPVPQAWITLWWHMGLRLPWAWRLGPSNSSERAHVVELLDTCDFPQRTLFCGDAGFIGYPLWSQILTRGADFLIRVGANVDLLTETAQVARQKHGLVLCWPKTARSAHQPPLRLRLTRVRVGQTRVWMLTSVLDPAALNLQQMVQFYQWRWGIEIEFRGLKQTLDRATAS